MYTFFTHKKAHLCPGGACEYHPKQAIQKIRSSQIVALVIFTIIIALIMLSGILGDAAKKSDCMVPEWAIKMGHGDMYRIHHGCE